MQDERELRFIIGHEMGHIYGKHVLYKVIIRAGALGLAGGFDFSSSVILPLLLAAAKWDRETEYSADAAGLICCQDLQVAERAFAKLAGGLHESIIGEINVDEFLRQADERDFSAYSEAFQLASLMMSDHPYLSSRIKKLREYSEEERYKSLWRK